MLTLLSASLAVVLVRAQSPISRGMTEDEVRGILGTPFRTSRCRRRSTWVYADRQNDKAVVVFQSGRVERVRFH